MQLHLYIEYAHTAANFCRGDYGYCFEVRTWGPGEHYEKKAIYVQSFEFDPSLVDTSKVLARAQEGLDEAEADAKAKYAEAMAKIEKSRGELLALEHKT